MASFIPKIVYGTGPTTINFTYPWSSDPGEQSKADAAQSTALAGDLQTSYNHTEVMRQVQFQFLSGTELAALQIFFDSWAKLGNSFSYYESKEINSFVTYFLGKLEFLPERMHFSPEINDWRWKVTLTFRRAT
jgi:hypothetical protein